MNVQKKTLAVALGGVFAASLAMSPVVNADQNPFAMKTLSKGYQVADKHEGEGKCGEGKCGEGEKKAKDGKCGEGEKKAKDGKCGEGKCGEKK